MAEVVALQKPPTLAELADEYGELARRIRMYAPDLDRAEAIRKQIGAHYEKEDPAQEFAVEGHYYVLRIGKRAITRIVTAAGIRKVLKALGQAAFLEACRSTFPKAKLDELKIEGIIEVRTGPRKIEAIALGPAKSQ